MEGSYIPKSAELGVPCMLASFVMYVSRWTIGIPLIALVFPISPSQVIPGIRFPPLITPTLLPPVTAVFSIVVKNTSHG